MTSSQQQVDVSERKMQKKPQDMHALEYSFWKIKCLVNQTLIDKQKNRQ